MRRAAAVSLVAAVGVLTAATAVAKNTSIAFSAGVRWCAEAILLTDASGSQGKRLTSTTGLVESDPAWSPDGRFVAFTGQRSDACTPSARGTTRAAVYVVRANGTGLRRIAAGHDPAWSPDGRYLVYADGVDALQVRKPTAGGHRSLGVTGLSPMWSPDGKTVAYVVPLGASGDPGIFATASGGRGGAARQLVAGDFGSPSWSPDGRRLLFQQPALGPDPRRLEFADTNRATYVADANGRNGKLVASGWDPAWGPDGKQILLTMARARSDGSRGYTRVLVRRPVGARGGPTVLAEDAAQGAWQP